MSTRTRQTDRPTDAPSRFERIAIVAASPRSPSEHWSALAAYANELADLFNFNPPTHNASGREV
jgi:hypothetical protein